MEFHDRLSRWSASALGMGTIIAVSASLSACKTNVQYAGTNNTDREVIYVAKVNDKEIASTPVAVGATLAPTPIGAYNRGSKVSLDVTLPEGGRIRHQDQTLLAKPDPTVLSSTTTTIPGIQVDFGNTADIETALSDISGSYRSPTPFVNNLIDTSLGGVFLVTDNPADAANPWVTLLYNPAQLGATVTVDFFAPGQFPEKLKVALILDKAAAAQVAADVPAITTVRADFNQASVYKYSFELTNTGWRTSPVSWNQIASALAATSAGRTILADIAHRISTLQHGQHIYYLNQAYIVGGLDVATYQAHALDASTDIQASTYVTAMGAFKVSDDSFDQKTAQNIVLRVKYDDLSLIGVAAPQPGAAALTASSALSLLGPTHPTLLVRSTPAVRTKARFAF